MTSSQRLEAFAKQLREYRNDPVGFAVNVLDVDPHPGQQRWLTEGVKPENILVTGNRWGKSHSAAMKRIWKCVYRIGWDKPIADAMARKHEGFQSVNVSITADQAALVWNKALAMLQGPKASWLVSHSTVSPFPRIDFINGSVFEARSTAGEGVRLLGHSFDDINWDEAAYEKRFEQIRDNVFRMRLVDRKGKLDYTSTGNGRNPFGLYFLEGLGGKNPTLYAQTGSSFENPHVPPEEIERTARGMSDNKRRQNIDGAIVDGGGEYFNLEDLRAAHDPELDAIAKVTFDAEDQESHVHLMPDGIAWREKYPSHKYIHGWDLADKSDWTVGTTWDVSTTPVTLVEFERFHKRGWDFVYERIRRRHKEYKCSRATKIDSTGLGDVVENELKDIGVEGVKFTKQTKDGMLTNLQTLLNLRGIRWPMIRVMSDEFSFYERDDEKLVTDCVMSVAVAGWWIKRGNKTAIAIRVW